MWNYFVEVRTGWGEIQSFFVPDCGSDIEVKLKLKQHFENHYHVELSTKRPKGNLIGYYIYEVTKLGKEIVPLYNYYPDD